MKTCVRTTLLLGLLFVISLRLSAQKHLFFNEGRLLSSFTLEQWNGLEFSTDNMNEATRFDREESLQLKEWMIDRESWHNAGSTELVRATRLEEESPVRLEDWMLRPGIRNRNAQLTFSELIRVEEEKPIELQKWMICCEDWMKASR